MSSRTEPLQFLPELGYRLSEERKRLQMTQEQVAATLGIVRQTIINHESEAHPIPLKYVRQLGELGADIHFLVFGCRRTDLVGVPDPDILEQVIEWADVLCKDRKGKPFSPRNTAKFMSAAYAYLATDHGPAETREDAEIELIKISRKVA